MSQPMRQPNFFQESNNGMGVLGLYKAFNALNSDDIKDLVEYATDYLKELPDETVTSEQFQKTITVAEELLTYMKTRYSDAKTRSRNTGSKTPSGSRVAQEEGGQA